MEKFLLASTALVASTTFALADVNISGSAAMGVIGMSDIDEDDAEDAELQFFSDIDVIFTMAGETDSGLAFGAAIELDDAIGDDGAAFDGTTQGGESVFVDGAYGRLTMGDTDGGFDWALEEAIIGGALNDVNEHAGYNGNAGLDGSYDGQVARYEYAFGDFALAGSAVIDDTDTDGSDPVLGIGARYSGDLGGVTFGAGAGYQSGADIADDGESFDRSVAGLSLSARLDNGLSAIFNYSHYDDDEGGDYDHYGLAVGYSFDAFLIAANYGNYDYDNDDFAGEGKGEGFGLVANYDLGGGAELQAGIAHNEPVDGDDFDTYSLGIAMSF